VRVLRSSMCSSATRASRCSCCWPPSAACC
jgi:hypothetical protein